MSDTPRVSDQIGKLIELVRISVEAQNRIIDRIEDIYQSTKKSKQNKYKYQELINFLKEKGKQEELVSTSIQTYTSKEQVLELLQEIVTTESKKKCLTEEEFKRFMRPSRPRISLEPPITGPSV